MCYMSDSAPDYDAQPPQQDTVGVRELRQNLSVYLRRVQRGERLTVTEHGKPVAELIPKVTTMTVLEELVASGLATAPTNTTTHWWDLPRITISGPSLSDDIIRMRDEETW